MTRSLTALKHLNHWNKCPYWERLEATGESQRFERSVAIERLERFEPHSFDLFFVAVLGG